MRNHEWYKKKYKSINVNGINIENNKQICKRTRTNMPRFLEMRIITVSYERKILVLIDYLNIKSSLKCNRLFEGFYYTKSLSSCHLTNST